MSIPIRRAAATRTIFVAAALGSSGFYAIFTVAPLVAGELTGSATWTGLPGAFGLLGVAIGSWGLSKVMARSGRRLGLRIGFVVGTIGTGIALAVTAAHMFAAMLAAMVLAGVGHAANQLCRFAAADMYPAERRASALGIVVWAGTVGAILGPNVVEPIAAALGLDRSLTGFIVGVAFFVGSVAAAILLRTDPSSLVTETAGPADAEAGASVWRMGHARIALASMVISQIAMVLVMTVTPVHVRHGGHGMGAVGIVMGSHFVGMFALAPVIGRLVGKIGSPKVILIGMATLVGASVAAAVVPASEHLLVAACLFGVGLGWSLGFVAGSAMLTRGLSYAVRVRLQGSIDAIVWSASAIASLGSGLLLGAAGFAILSVVGAAIAMTPVLFVLIRREAATVATPVAAVPGAMPQPLPQPQPYAQPQPQPWPEPQYAQPQPWPQPQPQPWQQPEPQAWPQQPQQPQQPQPALELDSETQLWPPSPQPRPSPQPQPKPSPLPRAQTQVRGSQQKLPAQPRAQPAPAARPSALSFRPAPDGVVMDPLEGDTATVLDPAALADSVPVAAPQTAQANDVYTPTVELAKALVAAGWNDPRVPSLLDALAQIQRALQARARKMEVLVRERDEIAGPLAIRDTVAKVREAVDRARQSGFRDQYVEQHLEMLEARVAQVTAAADRRRSTVEDQAIALAASQSQQESELATRLGELTNLITQVLPLVRKTPALVDVTAKFERARASGR